MKGGEDEHRIQKFLDLLLPLNGKSTMKIIHGERLHRIPLIYALLGLLCFLPSLYFFTKVTLSFTVFCFMKTKLIAAMIYFTTLLKLLFP